MSGFAENFEPGEDAAYISDIVQLVKEGIISSDVNITLGGCRNGALPENARNSDDPTSVNWANSPNPENIAQALSKALPEAIITANRTQVNASIGLNNPVTYKNGEEVNE